MRGKAALVAGLMLLMTAPPTAMAQSGGQGGTDEVTFYGHIFDATIAGPNPANTEAPVGEDNFGLGFGVNCQDVGPALPGAPTPLVGDDWESCQDEEGNKMVMFSTAGPVDVQNRAEFLQNGAYSQLHNERGQTKPVQLDDSGSISASLYGTWDTHGWVVGYPNPYGTNCMGTHPPGVPCMYPYWGWDPGVYEDVVMEATMYHANLGERTNSSQAPPIQEAVDSGEATVVAEGQWGPDQVVNGLPGSANAFHWEIDLGPPQVEEIPREDDFFLVFTTYQSPSGNDYCYDCPMRWWSGEFFPPSFELPVENAFTVERTVPNFANGKMAILGILNTPWGSYDVDEDSVDVEIEGPQGEVTPENIQRYSDFSVAHGGHFDPVNVTWIWDYRADDVPPGQYEVTVTGANAQNSAQATCTASFTIEADGEDLAPGEAEEAACGIQGVATEEAVEEAREGANETTEG
ncbi:hypothetical protein BRD56_05825 [Thermoplasmatales archaeon SW_10_69_26]|nr:MAG: hypothetical protein BRD56_05825 [Thermoplasmatales archaeon SW_10_69_26]